MMVHGEFEIATSKKTTVESRNVTEIEPVETKQLPKEPIKRPKKTTEKKLRKGRNSIHRYIKVESKQGFWS
jgi:hypothetical protein